MQEEKSGKRRKIMWAVLALVVVATVASSIVYVNIDNAINSALYSSLNTFNLTSVEYPLASLEAVDINITFSLKNPTSYTMEIDAMQFSFWVGENEIGPGVDIKSNQTFISSGETSFFFYFPPRVTDKSLLKIIRNQTYELTIRGKISASVHYFLIEANRSKDIDTDSSVPGLG